MATTSIAKDTIPFALVPIFRELYWEAFDECRKAHEGDANFLEILDAIQHTVWEDKQEPVVKGQLQSYVDSVYVELMRSALAITEQWVADPTRQRDDLQSYWNKATKRTGGSDISTQKYQFHFVEYDRENRTYYTKPADNCDPVTVNKDRRFWNEDEVQNQIEDLESEGFDDQVLCITISDDDDFETGGMFRILINYGAFSGMNFETEDLRPHVMLPEGVSTDDVFFCLFTNGNEEDSILQWAVFCPVED